MRYLRTAIASMILSAMVASPAAAAPIVSFTGGGASATINFVGQSFTTPIGEDWSDLEFNFFSDTSGGTTPTAAGQLFLLDTEYLGAPNGLSALTPGFIAQSTAIVGNVYQFDPSVIIQGGTQYFVYANAQVLVSGANSNLYPGGTAYLSGGAASNFFTFGGDANFLLQGSPVPEPGALLLMGIGLALHYRRNRARR